MTRERGFSVAIAPLAPSDLADDRGEERADFGLGVGQQRLGRRHVGDAGGSGNQPAPLVRTFREAAEDYLTAKKADAGDKRLKQRKAMLAAKGK